MLAETWRGTWVVAYREILRFVAERSRLVSSLMFPLLFLVIFGAGFSRVIGNLAPGVDFVMFMYPGILSMTVLTTSLFAGVSVVWDREYGFLKEILVAPIGRVGIVLGKALGAMVQTLIQVLLMLLLAPFVGVALGPQVILTLIPLAALLSLSLSSLGILLASFMRSQQGFQLTMQILIFPMIFLAGVFFPVNRVPTWVAVISKLNPLTYGVDAIRQALLGPSQAGSAIGVTVFSHTMTLAQDVAVMGLLAVPLLGAAAWAFSRQE